MGEFQVNGVNNGPLGGKIFLLGLVQEWDIDLSGFLASF